MTPQQAKDLCILAHEGQFRRDGITPYSSHPMAVAEMMTTDEEKILAYLHDMSEDTSYKLHRYNVPHGRVYWYYCLMHENTKEQVPLTATIGEALHKITKFENEDYNKYMLNLLKNPLATKVKIADMFHNISDNPSEKQKAKYKEALKILLASL